jgi:hypothetical protein
MVVSGTDISEDRVVVLEKKVRDMELLAKGLIQELLDLRSIVTILSKETRESSRPEPEHGPIVRDTASPACADSCPCMSVAAPLDNSTVIRPNGARQPDVPDAMAEPAMVRIMQADGTMKLEVRCGDRNQTDSSAGYGPTRMAHLSRVNRTL